MRTSTTAHCQLTAVAPCRRLAGTDCTCDGLCPRCCVSKCVMLPCRCSDFNVIRFVSAMLIGDNIVPSPSHCCCPGAQVLSWAAVPTSSRASTAGFAYSVDNSSVWTVTDATVVTLAPLQRGTHHSARVRVQPSAACLSVFNATGLSRHINQLLQHQLQHQSQHHCHAFIV